MQRHSWRHRVAQPCLESPHARAPSVQVIERTVEPPGQYKLVPAGGNQPAHEASTVEQLLELQFQLSLLVRLEKVFRNRADERETFVMPLRQLNRRQAEHIGDTVDAARRIRQLVERANEFRSGQAAILEHDGHPRTRRLAEHLLELVGCRCNSRTAREQGAK